jgi:serine/threonine-protein kinase
MDLDQDRIEEGVAGALAVPAGKRREWIRVFSAGDEEAEREISSLVFANVDGDFLERSIPVELVADAVESIQTERLRDDSFGNYRIVREIGRGGMGSVYLAERAGDDFHQQVALKVIRQTVLDDEAESRFRRERQILSLLDHPNIARLLDGGVSEKGEPFIAMEYVDGKSITDFAKDHSLDVESRLGLFLKVCSAVAFAHRNLIIHRDIKPSNILVRSDGEPKLLDFGLAKLLDVEGDPTVTVARALTPAYASPEQLRGELLTTSTDVYSLGLVLYELLTDVQPFPERTSRSLEHVLREVTDSLPSRPSTAAAQRGEPAGIGRDLDNIVLMALRAEPDRRYRSVEALVDDIENYLNGRPVAARANTVAYRLSRFVARNRLAVAAAAVVLIALSLGIGVSVWQARVARHERDVAEEQRHRAESISLFLAGALEYADPSAAIPGMQNRRDATIVQMLDDVAPRIEGELANDPETRAVLERTVGAAYAAQGRYADGERYLLKALEDGKAVFGDDSLEVAGTLALYGALKTQYLGDYAAGEQLLQGSVAAFRSRSPQTVPELRDYATALTALASIHWTRGDFKSADAEYSEALEIARRLVSTDAEPQATAKLGLGLTRYAKGDLDGAVSLLREAVEELRALPNGRWRLPDALNGLGQALYWRGNYSESSAVLKESSEISSAIVGKDSNAYARALWLRVFALCKEGRTAEAEPLLDESDTIYQRLSPNNPVILGNGADARAILLLTEGKLAEAEASARRAVAASEQSLPRGTPTITLARIDLADVLIREKRDDEAEVVLRQTYDEAVAAQGADHWRTRIAAGRLADLYTARGRLDLAANYR